MRVDDGSVRLCSAVDVLHVQVKRDRIVASVVVADERFAYTTPSLIASLLPAYPHLLEHACVNDRGTTFAAVAHHTSLPHLLEHMAIENQVRAEDERRTATRERGVSAQPGPESGVTYKGKTQWVDRVAREARIELSYADDLVALAALRDAARDLNEALRRSRF